MKNTKSFKTIKSYNTTCAVMWIAVSVAVIVGLIVTKSPWCLLAFIIPEFPNMSFNDKNEKENSEQFSDKW